MVQQLLWTGQRIAHDPMYCGASAMVLTVGPYPVPKSQVSTQFCLRRGAGSGIKGGKGKDVAGTHDPTPTHTCLPHYWSQQSRQDTTSVPLPATCCRRTYISAQAPSRSSAAQWAGASSGRDAVCLTCEKGKTSDVPVAPLQRTITRDMEVENILAPSFEMRQEE
eukprot:691695-Amphidinium_carterae.1